MSAIVKSIFSTTQSKERDQEISSKITKIETLIKEIQREKSNETIIKIKNVLDLALKDPNQESLYCSVYKNSARQAYIQWVPILDKSFQLLSPNSPFMKSIHFNQDYKIVIQKQILPSFLFRNSILTQTSPYLTIVYSVAGYTVPIIDYVFIRLAHALANLDFINFPERNMNKDYRSDEIFNYICKNPFLKLLFSFFKHFQSNQKLCKRLANIVKLYFVDQLIFKYRINKSSYRSSDFIFSTSRIQPHHLLAVFLLAKQGRSYFEEKDLYFNEIIKRFTSMVQKENQQICLKIFLRLYVFGFSKISVESQVIDGLEKANSKSGNFQLQRYNLNQFNRHLRVGDKRQKEEFNASKAIMLKWLENDQTLPSTANVQFSIIRTVGAFLWLQIVYKSNQSQRYSQDQLSQTHRINSQMSSLQQIISKFHTSVFLLKKKINAQKSDIFSDLNMKSLQQQLRTLNDLYKKAYGRQITLNKSEDVQDDLTEKSFNIKGLSKDYSFSIESYRKDIEMNCWRAPLKASQFQTLFSLFFWLAQKLDRYIPGHDKRKYPCVNLRYFCNPVVFVFTLLIIMLLLKSPSHHEIAAMCPLQIFRLYEKN